MDPGVIPVALGEEEVLLPWMEQSLTGEGLPIRQALGQGLAPRLGQQQQTDDAQQGATSKDHVMQEVALLVVELHDGGGEHAEASAGQDQAQASAPEQTGEDCVAGGQLTRFSKLPRSASTTTASAWLAAMFKQPASFLLVSRNKQRKGVSVMTHPPPSGLT